ncbi:MAG TPA: hypothetical protein GX708_20445, partial [Gallicola sp.]|nr:hypothetical protein [Gallicola sp.]
ITQLEAGKVYLEQQIENRDKALTELREWIAQLEAGKAYLEQQIESRDNTLAELKAHLDRVNEQHEKERRIIEEQEQKVLMLTNENKKLAFYLNEELNKPWYKKIFCKNRKIY